MMRAVLEHLGVAILVGLLCFAWPASASPGEADGYSLAGRARAAFRSGDHARAADLYRSVCAGNPHVAIHWEALGHSLLRTGRYAGADSSFQRCIGMGYRISAMYYNIACSRSLATDVDGALDALANAYRAGFLDDHLVAADTDLDLIRKDPRFDAIVGKADPRITDRIARWNADLDYFDRRMRELHYDLFAELSVEDYESTLRAIRIDIGALDDMAIRYALQSLLARVGDGHTAIVLERFLVAHGNAPNVDLLPFEPWLYDDGVRIRAVPEAHGDLLGARILGIDGTPVDDVLRRIDGIVSRDNEWSARWIGMEHLRSPAALRALGISRQPDRVRLEVETSGGEVRDVEIEAASWHPQADLLRLGIPKQEGRGDVPIARYLRDRDRPFWVERIADPAMLWWQFNAVHEVHGETFAHLAARLEQDLADPSIQALVIDLRNNHGGQGHLVQPALHAIIAWDKSRQPERIFIVTSRETFSAAMAFAAKLDAELPVVFVGEPTGSRPNFVGESSIFVLPYSRVPISCSTRFHQNGNPTDTRLWIGPEIAAPLTFADEQAGRDPAFEAIVAVVRDRVGH